MGEGEFVKIKIYIEIILEFELNCKILHLKIWRTINIHDTII